MAEIAPTRSRTDPSSAEHQRTQRPHIARRLHANSFRSKGQWGPPNGQQHHHHHSYRHSAKDTVQSAIELKPPINLEHILRRDRRTPESSRRGSGNAVPVGQPDGSSVMTQSDAVERKVGPEDVARAKRDNARREEELRASLKSVEEIGMSSTRQLDDTYYAILDKASILRSTVAGLQHLADESKAMHASFQEDTTKLEQDTEHNVKGFGNFEQQERTINELVTKLQDSKARTTKLNDRLESARLRVEAYERSEKSKQAKRRARFQIGSGTVVGILLLVLTVILVKHRKAVGLDLQNVEQHLARLGDLVDDVAAPLSSRLKPTPTEDPYLQRLFNDL